MRAKTTAGLLDRERIIAGPGFNRWLVPPAAAYNATMYLLAGLLVDGLIGNWLVRPVHDSRFMSDDASADAAAAAREASWSGAVHRSSADPTPSVDLRRWVTVGAAWMLVGFPLVWGVLQTIRKASLLFG